MWIVGDPQHMIHPCSVFQDGRELDHFPGLKNKYNETNNIMTLV